MKLWISFFISVLLLLVPVHAQDLHPLDPGGLAGAWLVPDDRTDRATAFVVVLAGEAHNEGTEGLAHYVEHLAWHSAVGDAHSGFARHSNAETGLLGTRYWLNGAADDLDGMLESMAEIFAPIDLAEAFIADERDIVLREYESRMGENPYAPLIEDLDRRLHDSGPLGRSVIGTPENIVAFSFPEARALHAATHRPDNAVLIVYGNVDAETANVALAGSFGAIGEGVVTTPLNFTMPAPGRYVRAVAVPDLTRPELFYRKIVALEADWDIGNLALTAALLRDALDSNLAGGIAKPLRFDAFLAQGYEFSIDVLDARHVMISFFSTPDTGVPLQDLLDAFESIMADRAASGIPEESFARIKKRKLDALRRDRDPARTVLNRAFNLIALRQTPQDLASFIADVEAVDLDRVNALLAAFVAEGRVAITLASP